MLDNPLSIAAAGFAALLIFVGLATLVWSFRCSPQAANYKLPALAVSIPIGFAAIAFWYNSTLARGHITSRV